MVSASHHHKPKFCENSTKTHILIDLVVSINILFFIYLPSPETSNEFRNRSSPALNVVMQSPDSKFIKFTYIRLRDKHTKCCASLQYAKYGIFWFMTPLSVTCNDKTAKKKLATMNKWILVEMNLNLPEVFLCSNRWFWFHGDIAQQHHDYRLDKVPSALEYSSIVELAPIYKKNWKRH